MLYQDLIIQDDKGIYTALLDKLGSNNIVNDTITAQKLDTRFSFENNLKDCLFDSLDNAVDVLIAKYSSKWNKLLSAYNNKLPDGATSYTLTNSKQNANNTNNISAYDSSDLLPDSGTNSDSSVNVDETKYTLTGKQLILNLYNNVNIYDIINADIRKTLFRNVQILDKEY